MRAPIRAYNQILFLVYENDLQTNTSLKVLNFANDTLLYTTFKTDTAYLNSELSEILIWSKDIRLELNTDKTRCMLFHSIKTGYWKNIILEIKKDNLFIKKLNS